MVDDKNLKCMNCKITQANTTYNNYCAFCFINTHPDNPQSIKARSKSKELQVVVYITNTYTDFIYNQPFYVDLEGGCCSTKRRVDLRTLIHDQYILEDYLMVLILGPSSFLELKRKKIAFVKRSWN